MMGHRIFLLTLLCILAFTETRGDSDSLARGFNDDIAWKNMEDGLKEAKETNKPLMVLIHKSWCGACKKLKPKFTTSYAIVEESQGFVMVNIQDEEEEKLDKKNFTPDGGYIPRIFFLESDGTVRKDIINTNGNKQYKYFYSDEHQVVKSMKEAKNLISSGGSAKNNKEL